MNTIDIISVAREAANDSELEPLVNHIGPEVIRRLRERSIDPMVMIDTINSPPGSIQAFSWWEYLTHGQKPYQYYADAYIMANKTWFDGLPEDLQQLLIEDTNWVTS